MEKKCVKCQKLKSIDEFNKHNIIEYDNLFMCETCKKEEDKFFEESMLFLKKQMIQNKILKQKNKFKLNKINPVKKLTLCVDGLIYNSIKRKGYPKNAKIIHILKCDYNYLLDWLNGIASNGHTYGFTDLHLDHVVPLSLSKTIEETLLLNHYSNLQLLTADENLTKGNRYVNPTNLKRVLEHHPNPDKIREIHARL